MASNLTFELPSDLPHTMPVVPLRGGVLLPGAVLPITIGRRSTAQALETVEGGLVIVAAQRDKEVTNPGPTDLLPLATLARIVDEKTGRAGMKVVVFQGLCRVRLSNFTTVAPYMRARAERCEEAWPLEDIRAAALERAFKETLKEAAEVLGLEEQVPQLVAGVPTMALLVDAIAGLIEAPTEWLQQVLQTLDPVARAEHVLRRVTHLREVVSAQKTIRDRLNEEAQQMGREHMLRRQLKAIQEELGENEDDEIDQLRERLQSRPLPEPVRQAVDRELKRLERLGPSSPERSVTVDWLEWIADLPWSVTSASAVTLNDIEEGLDQSHYGLEDVKEQVIQHLAVRLLAGSGRADVLLLVGPPGVGKTSIAQAIADATGRELLRIALGGVRDEAELRGHRRTYIGSRPGRIIEGFRRAGTIDPVVVLDEVDKLAQGYMGDPSAALLEILDPEQNHSFTDHYLEVPFDLSKALFVATANDLTPIRGPLRDRMEVIHIAGYTREEKVVIARQHLLDKLARNAGLAADDVAFDDAVIAAVVAGWTREAGVRQLQRELGKIYRAAAVKKARGELSEPLVVTEDQLKDFLGRIKFLEEDRDFTSRPGIATGLAWTPTGGDILSIESSTLRGTGKLVLTGQLGDGMNESARAALTYVLSHDKELGIADGVLDGKDLHIHIPAGAVPKDGPSAGVTMFTALASLLSGRAVRGDVAMTGEATLRGRALPVGGIKDKVLAAHRQGMKRVILPRKNEGDLEDVPEEARRDLEFILVDFMDQVLDAALEPTPPVAVPTLGRDEWDQPYGHTTATH
jgi:ATP-dependent Lon protease